MPAPGPLWFLFCFWQTLFPVWEELSGKAVTYEGRTAREWLRVLKKREKKHLTSAFIAVGSLRVKAAVPELLEMLKDEQFRTSGNLRGALAEIGPASPDLIPGLLQIMGEADPGARHRALEVLSQLETDALQPLLPRLVAHLEAHPAEEETNKTLDLIRSALDHTATPLPYFRSLLKHRHAGVRRVAVESVSHRPEMAGQIALVEERLQDQDAEVRRAASMVLRRLAARGKAPLRYFLHDLLQGDWRPLYQLKEDVEHLGPQAQQLVPELLAALEKSEGHARLNVAAALWRIDGDPTALETLLQLTQDKNEEVSYGAYTAFAYRVNPQPEARQKLREYWLGKKRSPKLKMKGCILAFGKHAEPLLADALRDDREVVRLESIKTLEEILEIYSFTIDPLSATVDYSAKEALAAARELAPLAETLLVRHCRHETDPKLQYRSALLLWKHFEHPSALVYLSERLNDMEVPAALRAPGAEALPLWSEQADLYLPHVLAALKDQDSTVRTAAARQLGWCRPAPPAVIQALQEMLRDADPGVRFAAIRALGNLGRDAHPAIRDLEKLLNSPFAEEQAEALKALGRLQADEQRLFSYVQPRLLHVDSAVRLAAFDVLTSHPGLARKALPALLPLLRDPDHESRRAVLYVMQKSGPLDPTLEQAVSPLLDDPRTEGTAAFTLWRAKQLSLASRKGLERMLLEVQGESRFVAAMVLYKHIRHPWAFAILRNGLMDRHETTQQDAVHFLAYLGADARSLKPQLVTLMRQPASYLTVETAAALWRIDRAPEALTALIRMMQDKNGQFATDAGQALVNLGADAKAVEPALRKLLQHPRKETRAAARWTLFRLAQTP